MYSREPEQGREELIRWVVSEDPEAECEDQVGHRAAEDTSGQQGGVVDAAVAVRRGISCMIDTSRNINAARPATPSFGLHPEERVVGPPWRER